MFNSIRTAKNFGSREWLLYGTFLVLLVVGVGAASRYTAANADYICTIAVDDLSDCGNGAWGPWQTVSSTDDTQSCVKTVISQRTYTGTRVSTHTLSYLNLRTACQAGYTQTQAGNSTGASGNKGRGGTITTQTSACQIQQTAQARAPINNGMCTNTSATTTSFDYEQADLNVIDTTTATMTMDQVDAAFAKLAGAHITAVPTLVHAGDSTVVRWKSQKVESCTVTGTNGDSWTGLTGKENSGAITTKTTYTMNCLTSNGTPVVETATVDVIPSWQEI